MGRELPPAEVLAADQRITAWARQLKKAGLDGDMDELRARAYLDLLLDKDSRPSQDAAARQDGRPTATAGRRRRPGDGGGPGRRRPAGGGGPGQRDRPHPAGDRAGAIPAGFAGRVTLTIPLATLLGLADRPGEIPGIGPIDPPLARDLARAAAGNPRTTWCVTVTDEDGHAIGHGCARPEPRTSRRRDKPANRPAGRPRSAPRDQRHPGPGSPSPPPASTARRADTAPGGCPPGPAGSGT